MTTVEIYIKPTCPFCVRAKALLDSKGVEYTEYNIAGDEELRAKMIERTGGAHTVPEIFIDNKLIGGCDDLHALEDQGELDTLLDG